MADKYYAWTRFPLGKDEWGRTTGYIQPGDEVDTKKLDCSDDAFAQLIEIGSVRTTPYPVPKGSYTSPVEHLRNEALRLAAGAYSDEDAQNALTQFTDARDSTGQVRVMEAEEHGSEEDRNAARESQAAKK